jgi:hypothetical protein
MDMIPLNKKCIFIPTPGQTEQEYLCNYLEQKNLALSFSQNDFSLPAALGIAKQFNYSFYSIPPSGHPPVEQLIQSFLSSL